jgi:hypothetical protein
MVGSVDELRGASDQDRDVVGKILGIAEALEAVRGEILVGDADRGLLGFESQGLARSAGDTVRDSISRGFVGAADGREALAARESPSDILVVDDSLSVIIRAKGLPGKGFATSRAAVSRDLAESFCRVGSPGDEVGIGCSGSAGMVTAPGRSTNGNGKLNSPAVGK